MVVEIRLFEGNFPSSALGTVFEQVGRVLGAKDVDVTTVPSRMTMPD
jgi:hypothetical protein